MSEFHFASTSAAAARVPCPFCMYDGLKFVLRCDLSQGPCLFTALCESCHEAFEIAVSESELDPASLVDSVGPCTRCGDTRQIATLSCSDRSFACVYHVQCPTCGRKVGSTA